MKMTINEHYILAQAKIIELKYHLGNLDDELLDELIKQMDALK